MAVDAQRSRATSSRALAYRIGPLLRLPVEWAMIPTALRAARR
jgi:hypothetical protein